MKIYRVRRKNVYVRLSDFIKNVTFFEKELYLLFYSKVWPSLATTFTKFSCGKLLQLFKMNLTLFLEIFSMKTKISFYVF